jgi:two-component system chemotaxis sensor kinase CheA
VAESNADLIADYLGEAKDYLEKLNEKLMLLEDGVPPPELVNELFRSAHSLKGLSACFGFDRTKLLTHRLENLLSAIKRGDLVPEPVLVRTMFDAVDVLEALTSEIASAGVESTSIEDYLGRLDAACQATSVVIAVTAAPAPTVGAAAALASGPPVTDTTTSTSATSVTPKSATKGKDTPTVERAKHDGATNGADTRKQVPNMETETVRVSMERLDKLLNMTGELVIARSRFQLACKTLQSLPRIRDVELLVQDLVRGLEQDLDGEQSEACTQRLARLRQQGKRLSTAMQDLGGLTAFGRDLEEATYDMEGIVGGLHTAVLETRLVPLDAVFRRLQRVVRDTAEHAGKEVQVEFHGGDTQVDKKVADELQNPLVHLVRNAIDHGLEAPQQRLAAGKPRQGKLVLRGIQLGSTVVVEIADDGAGIDPQRVAKKAIEVGILGAEQAATMSEPELQRLIFRPGFSTAQKVTELSGRGMGMDIVEAAMKKLRGSIELDSHVGKGTRFAIQLPPSVSILACLLLQSRGTTFAVPLTEVREIVRLDPERVVSVQGRAVVVVREKPLPIYGLDELFTFVRGTSEATGEVGHAIVLQSSRFPCALRVDRLLGKEDLVMKPLCHELSHARGLAGMAVRGDGCVTLILDPSSLGEGQIASGRTQVG